MNENGNVIQFWDEFTTFISTFGLYKGGNSAFDKSLILSIYNSSHSFNHTTKSYSYEISEPRLAIFTAGHEWKAVELIDEEKKHTADGFITRFLICCPKPRIFKYDELEPVSSTITFEKIFLAIQFTHITAKNYSFDEEGFNLFKEEGEHLESICRNNERKN